MSDKIIIPYKPRALAKNQIHRNLERHRFSVLVCHRRFGKTVLVINHVIKQAIKCDKRMPRYAYVAPFRKQAKEIAWSYLKYYTHVIPGIKINESDLYIEFPSHHEGCNGARIYICGADNPDSLRGAYWDGVILDEYAQIRAEAWNEVIRPSLSDRKGWAIFVGTPKGQNQFYEMYQKSVKEDDWYSCVVRADESGLYDVGGDYGPEEYEQLQKDMSDDAFRQEYLCDFTASAFNVLISIDEVTEAANRTYRDYEISKAPKIMGVDVARYGNDSCVISKRQGLVAFEPQIFRDIDNMTFAAYLMQEIDRWQPDAVFIDAGRGEGVIDRCRQMGYEVTEVNFGSKALKNDKYINKRCEMWDEMRDWIVNKGGAIPQVPELKSELVVPEYSFDPAGRMKLMSKDEIKDIMGKSPDIADSLALTFAFPVRPKGFGGKRAVRCNTSYDIFD